MIWNITIKDEMIVLVWTDPQLQRLKGGIFSTYGVKGQKIDTE